MGVEQYHQQLRAEKRSALLVAAKDLFLAHGYKNTSLQQVANQAGISTATLFKNFPTKASLLEAIVQEFWRSDVRCDCPSPATDPSRALYKIGLDYATRMRSSEMQAFYRLVISEVTSFPDLGAVLYQNGKGIVVNTLESFLRSEIAAGTIVDCDPPTAAAQFLALISGQVFWPELMGQGCGGTDEDVKVAVDGAVEMMLRRYYRVAS